MDSLLESNLSDITNNYYHYLLSLKNVYGVGLGYKKTNGIITNKPCIHVLVKNKINIQYLGSDNIVPRTYMGMLTDVIEMGTVRSIPDYTRYKIRFPYRTRPLFGGCRLYTRGYTATLGCTVFKKNRLGIKQYFILGTNDFLANGNFNPIGNSIFQNNLNDKLSTKDAIANLTSFVPLKYSNDTIKRINYIDCAIAKIANRSLVTDQVFEVGNIEGMAWPVLGETVQKVGYVTGLTGGKIISKNVTLNIPTSVGNLIYKYQYLADFYTQPGDSGSIVLNKDNKAVGLLFLTADSESTPNEPSVSAFCDINIVTSAFGVDIYSLFL